MGCLAAFVAFAGCRRQEEGASPQSLKTITTKSGIEMVLIPAGSFQMGSDGVHAR